jgi:hypothetical protein
MKGKLVTGERITGTWYCASAWHGRVPAVESHGELSVLHWDNPQRCEYCSQRATYHIVNHDQSNAVGFVCGKHAPHLVEEAADGKD